MLFFFLRANIDVISTATKLGINEVPVANYHPDIEGTQLNYEVVNDMIIKIRENTEVKGD